MEMKRLIYSSFIIASKNSQPWEKGLHICVSAEIVRFWNMTDSHTDDNNFTSSRNPTVNAIERTLNECIISAKRTIAGITFKYI